MGLLHESSELLDSADGIRRLRVFDGVDDDTGMSCQPLMGSIWSSSEDVTHGNLVGGRPLLVAVRFYRIIPVRYSTVGPLIDLSE